jgi:hypothetical protein
MIRINNSGGSPSPIPTPIATLSEVLCLEEHAGVVEVSVGVDPSGPKIDLARAGKDRLLLASISSQILWVRL